MKKNNTGKHAAHFGVVILLLATGAGILSAGGMTLDEAVQEGLSQNSSLVSRLIEARQAAAEVLRVAGVYDTELSANLYYTDAEMSSAASPIDSASRSAHGDAAIQRRLSTGTSVGLKAESDHVRFAESQFADQNNQTVFSLSLSQSLLRDGLGKANRAQVAAAKARYESTWLSYLDERDAVALEIHRAFWNAYNEFSSFRVLQNGVSRAEKLLDINRQREVDGLLDETDVLAAEAALASQTVEVIAQQDAYIRTREGLLALIRHPMKSWEDVRLDFESGLQSALKGIRLNAWELYRDARSTREQFKALEQRIEEAQWTVESAAEQVQPELNVFGEFGLGDVDTTYRNSWGTSRMRWTVGLEFRTSWDRSAEQSILNQAELEVDALEDQIVQAEYDLLLACRTSARDLVTLNARLEAARLARELHGRKLVLETKKFEQGRSETSRIIDYQDDLEIAEGAVISAEAAYRIRAAENLRLQGRLSGPAPDRDEETP